MRKSTKKESALSQNERNSIIKGAQDLLIKVVGDNVRDRIWRVILIAAISMAGALLTDNSKAYPLIVPGQAQDQAAGQSP